MAAVPVVGPWVPPAAPRYDYCELAMYYPPAGAGVGPHTPGGAQATYDSRSPGVDGHDIWQSVSETHGAGRYTFLPPPDPAAGTAEVSMVNPYVTRKGLPFTEPSLIGTPSTVVGYEVEGAPARCFNQSRCNSNNHPEFYSGWVASGEQATWQNWLDYEAIDSLIGNATCTFKVTGSTISSRGLGATFTIGTPAETYFFLHGSTASIAPKSVFTTLLHPHTYSNSVGLTATISDDFDLLPNMPLCTTKMISLAVRISDIPYPYNLVADNDFEDASVFVDGVEEFSSVFFFGTGQGAPYRYLSAPPFEIIIPPAAPPTAKPAGRGIANGDLRGRQVNFPAGR
jgi:hypothetical protein